MVADLSDDDIDPMIEQAQREVEPRAERGSFSTPTFWSAQRAMQEIG